MAFDYLLADEWSALLLNVGAKNGEYLCHCWERVKAKEAAFHGKGVVDISTLCRTKNHDGHTDGVIGFRWSLHSDSHMSNFPRSSHQGESTPGAVLDNRVEDMQGHEALGFPLP